MFGLLRGVLLGMLATASAFTAAAPSAAVAARPLPPSSSAALLRRTPAARMGLMDFLSNLLYDGRRSAPSSGAGSDALSRLKVVLAADRTGLDEQTMAKIRIEIQEVISKYVNIIDDDIMFDLQSDDKITLVTATFPLRGARARNEMIGTPKYEDNPTFEAPVGLTRSERGVGDMSI